MPGEPHAAEGGPEEVGVVGGMVGVLGGLGGFFCPCHGSKFDLAGRVYQGVPAPLNLVVPPYRYASATKLIIGEDAQGKTA